MRKLFYLGLLFLSCFHGRAQDVEEIKHLKESLRSANATEKYLALNNLAWNYRSVYPDSAIYYGEQAYTLGKQLNRKDISRSLNFIGLAYFHKNDVLAAYDYFHQALTTSEEKFDSLQFGHANNNIGKLLIDQGLTERASVYLNQARYVFESIHDSSGLAYNYQSLATYNQLIHKPDEAQRYLLEAYKIRIAIDDRSAIISALLQLGKHYIQQQQVDEAQSFFMKADSVARVMHDTLMMAESTIRLAECFLVKGNLPQAEQMASQGLAQIKRTGNERLLPESYLIVGRIYHQLKNYNEARIYFSRTLEVATTRKDLSSKLEAYFFLWQSAKLGPSRTHELEAFTDYITLKDSLNTLDAEQQQVKWKFQLELERRDAEYAVLQAREQRKTAVIVVLVIIIISIAAILYLLMRTKRRILRVNHLLEDRNGQIKKMNAQLELKNTILEDHVGTIMEFSKNRSISVGNLKHAAKDIVSITAKHLKVSQVSIWIYDETKQCIESIACYNLKDDTFVNPSPIRFSDAPNYFDAIRKEKIIAADEARIFSATREFANHYFLNFDIHSLLDVTFFLDGQLKGLLCCEQQGAPRVWSAEDKLFACSVADVITLSFRTAQRLEYEKHIKDQKRKIEDMNEVLEARVKERTLELEMQNAKLAEYAFINSHLLRGPVSRILGLINLFTIEKENKEELLPLLEQSGQELDEIVKKISDALHEGNPLSIKNLSENSRGNKQG